MKIFSLLIVSCCLFYACSSNPSPSEKPTGGADFMKEEKAKIDLKIVDPKATVIKINLKAIGNTMSDMLFDKDTIKVPANSTIELTLENASIDQSMQHNFVLIEKGSIQEVADAGVKAGTAKDFIPEMDEVLIATKLTKPGEKATIVFAAPAKGTYDFICTYPGHYARMKGVFIVE